MRAIAFAVALLASAPAVAQMMCASQIEVVDMLANEYGERQVVSGISTGGALLQIFAAPSGTWTLAITQEGGPTCVFMVGEDWQPRPVPEKRV